MGFSRDFFVTTEVMQEKRSQTQGNLHQWFRIHRPTGITHIPAVAIISRAYRTIIVYGNTDILISGENCEEEKT
jgi:hypothetical protein